MKILNKIVTLFVFILLIFNFIYCINADNSTNTSSNEDVYNWAGRAQDFLDSADNNINISSEQLNKPSSEIYNVLTSMGMVLSVVVGLILGIKYMLTSVDEKAKVMESLLPYVIGCIIIFGAFGIWKIFINTFYNI